MPEATPALEEVRCAECQSLLRDGDDRQVTPGGTFCRICYDKLSAQLTDAIAAQGRDINYGMAILGGVLGGAIGVFAWWGFTVLTEISFGLVAVVIGLAVGHGVVRLSGGKKSASLQGLAIALAVLSYAYATYLVNRTFIERYLAGQGTPTSLPVVPGPAMFYRVATVSFGIMDVVFLAIVVYEAWKIPRPARIPA